MVAVVILLLTVGIVDNEGTEGGTHSHANKSEKARNIAQKAAQEAKAASDAQNIAGQQAARQVLLYIRIFI